MNESLLTIARYFFLAAGIIISSYYVGISIGEVLDTPITFEFILLFLFKVGLGLAFIWIFVKSIFGRIIFVIFSVLFASFVQNLTYQSVRFDVPYFEGATLSDNCATVERSILCRNTDYAARIVFAVKCLDSHLLSKPTDLKADVCKRNIIVSDSELDAISKGSSEIK